MKTIVAVDNVWGIGKNNQLLFSLKADMKHFVEMTTGKVVVMGSNTFLSLPNAQPLKNRVNIVLWPGGKAREDIVLVESLADLFNELKKYSSDDVFIIGGAMMYHTMLPYCDTAYITKVFENGNATAFFDNLDLLPNWRMSECLPPVTDGNYEIQFCTYTNVNPLPLK